MSKPNKQTEIKVGDIVKIKGAPGLNGTIGFIISIVGSTPHAWYELKFFKPWDDVESHFFDLGNLNKLS